MALTRSKSSQPSCRLCQRSRERPLHQNQRQTGNQNCLHESIQQRIAPGPRDLFLDVAGLMKKRQCAHYLAAAMQRQGVDVQRHLCFGIQQRSLFRAQKLPNARLSLFSACRRRRTHSECRCQPWRDGQRSTYAAVDCHALQMLSLAEPLHQPLQTLVLPSLQKRFHAFLQALSKDLRPVRKIVSEQPLFRPHLISRKKQRHKGNAHDQW